jgi:signal transduction histidine kinase
MREVQVRHAQKLEAVGQLAAGVAHEINTPVQFVGDSAHFLKEAFSDLLLFIDGKKNAEQADLDYLREQIPKALDRTISGLDRVADIVRALKEFSHSERGEMAPASINRLIENTLIVCKNEYKYVADVETKLGEIPHVYCHAGDVSQVLLNLVVNAAHAIREKVGSRGRGRITIESRCEDADVVVSVRDDGNGIPPAVRDRIFEPFFTTKGVGQGTGQGLAISRTIVTSGHGGALDFETEEGWGTRFSMRLPVGHPVSFGV